MWLRTSSWFIVVALLCALLAPVQLRADGLQSQTFTSVTPGNAINLIGTAISFHKLTWTISGTVSTCTVALDTSVDSVTWTAGGAVSGQTCTSNGASSIANVTANYVRLNVTALSGSGATVAAVWTGYINNPGGSASNLTIDVGSQSGANFDTQQINNATITNSSANVSAPSGTFKASDVGKNFVGFRTCNTGTTAANDAPVIAETTITAFTDSAHITVGASATAAGTCIVWGHPDDAAFTNADSSAAVALYCPTINLPAEMGWIESPHFIQVLARCTANSPSANGGQVIGWGETIRGQGKGASILFIGPNLKSNLASCTGGPNANACFFGQQGQNLRDFHMTGLDNIASGFGSAKVLLDFATYSALSNVLFDDFGGNDANDSISTGSVVMWDTDFAGMPNVLLDNDPGAGQQTYIFSGGFQSNCVIGGAEATISAGAEVMSMGTTYTMGTCVNGLSHTSLQNNANYFSYGDLFFNETTSNFTQASYTGGASSNGWFFGTFFSGLSGTNTNFEPINNPNATGFVYLNGVRMTCGSAANAANNAGTIVDGGGIVMGSCGNGTNAWNLGKALVGVASQAQGLTPASEFVASRNTALSAVTLLAANANWSSTGGFASNFILHLYAYDSAAGSGCSANSTVTWTISYTDVTGTGQTQTATETITTNGGATGGDKLATTFNIAAKMGTAITYSATAPTGGSCTTVPSFAAQLTLN